VPSKQLLRSTSRLLARVRELVGSWEALDPATRKKSGAERSLTAERVSPWVGA
jgi:hypothetical protein